MHTYDCTFQTEIDGDMVVKDHKFSYPIKLKNDKEVAKVLENEHDFRSVKFLQASELSVGYK